MCNLLSSSVAALPSSAVGVVGAVDIVVVWLVAWVVCGLVVLACVVCCVVASVVGWVVGCVVGWVVTCVVCCVDLVVGWVVGCVVVWVVAWVVCCVVGLVVGWVVGCVVVWVVAWVVCCVVGLVVGCVVGSVVVWAVACVVDWVVDFVVTFSGASEVVRELPLETVWFSDFATPVWFATRTLEETFALDRFAGRGTLELAKSGTVTFDAFGRLVEEFEACVMFPVALLIEKLPDIADEELRTSIFRHATNMPALRCSHNVDTFRAVPLHLTPVVFLEQMSVKFRCTTVVLTELALLSEVTLDSSLGLAVEEELQPANVALQPLVAFGFPSEFLLIEWWLPSKGSLSIGEELTIAATMTTNTAILSILPADYSFTMLTKTRLIKTLVCFNC